MFTGGGIEIERLGIPNAHFVSVSLDLELEHRITSDIDGVKKMSQILRMFQILRCYSPYYPN